MSRTGFITVTGCKRCGKCDGICEAIFHIDGIARINHEKCNLCMKCIAACPNKSIKFLD